MRKILAGFVVALAIGLPAIYFGVPWWAEQKALRELDATLEILRGTGANASRGAASYDLWTRTLKVSDLSIRSNDPARAALKVGQLTATGIANVEAARFSADRIDVTDAEVAGLQIRPHSLAQTYRIPKLTAERFIGPTEFTPRPSAIPDTDDVLAAFTAYAAMSAAKVTIPSMKVTNSAPPLRGTAVVGAADYEVTDAVIESLANGKIQSATVARVAVEGRLPDASTFTSEIEKIRMSEIDINAAIAALDPAQQKDDKFRRIYRQIVTGPYTVNFGAAGQMRADSVQIDDFAIRPWKVFDPLVISLAETLRSQAGKTPSPTETAAMLEKFATIYEGLWLGKFEARGFVSDFGTKVPAKIGVIRLAGLDAGKIAELAVENVEVTPPSGDPASLGRFAFKGLDFVKLMRVAAQLSISPSPGLEQALGFLPAIGGIELKNFKGVERTTMQPLEVETFELSWGKFVGAIPSQIRAATKFTAVVDPKGTDPNLRYLVDAGIRNVNVDVDLGAAWNENTRMIALMPVTATFSKVIGFSASAALANVSNASFSPNPLAFGMAAAQIEAGPIDITVRDLGITDLIFAQMARDQGTTPDTMRTRMIEMIRAVSLASPEIETIGTALARLIENRGTTLNVLLTPKARVNLMQSVEIARADPLLFLSQFKVEARTDR
jgi:hypothetical protein